MAYLEAAETICSELFYDIKTVITMARSKTYNKKIQKHAYSQLLTHLVYYQNNSIVLRTMIRQSSKAERIKALKLLATKFLDIEQKFYETTLGFDHRLATLGTGIEVLEYRIKDLDILISKMDKLLKPYL